MKIKKCLSLLVSAVMVFSAFGAGMSAFAEEGSITPITQVKTTYSRGDQIDFSAYGKNLLNPQYFEAAFYKDNEKTDEEPNCPTLSSIGRWFDSNGADDSLMFGGNGEYSKDAANDTEQTKNYWSLKFKINGTLNNPQKFIFSFHKNESWLMSKHYAVFASDNYSDLGNKKIIEIRNDTGRAADEIDISDLELTNIKYVEVRIYHRGYDSSYQHINELGFFGGEIVLESAVTAHTTKALSEIDLNNNRLADAEVVNGFYGNGVKNTGNNSTDDGELPTTEAINNVLSSKIPESSDGFFGSLGAFHDGDSIVNCRTYGFDNSILQTDSYWQMQFTLNGYLKNPEYFVFSARNDGKFTSNHYAVFASDDSFTLYNEENKIIEIISDENRGTADLVDLTGKEITALYIGIRFYHRGHTTGSGCSVQFLTKVGIYGGEYVESTAHTTYPDIWWVVADKKAYDDKSFNGINRLRGQKVTRTFVKENEVTLEKSDNDPPYYNGLVDSSALGRWHTEDNTCYSKGAPNDILQTNSYWQMEAELSAPLNNPEYFSVIFHPTDKTLRSQHYAIFASDSQDNLYNDGHKIIEIVDESERIGDSVDLTALNLTGIKYIGIRFYQRGYSMPSGCSLQHISEIGIYGGTLQGISFSASEGIANSAALNDGTADGTEISYNDGFAWYEESFSERAINNVTLYFEDTDKLPQDIGIDVKIGDNWKRVAEKHDIAYNGDKSADFWFASVEGASAVRIMASNARNNSAAFALSEIQVGNDTYFKADKYTGIAKPDDYKYRAAIAGDVNNDLLADATDLVILRKYLLTEEYDGFSSLDSNYDGNVDILDLVRVKKAIK